MPGPDRIHQSLRFFDRLARQTCDVERFLHPDLKEHLPRELEPLAALRARLYAVAEEVTGLIARPGRPWASKSGAHILTTVLDCLTSLGWKTRSSAIWLELADNAPDTRERLLVLRRALARAESVEELDKIREKIRQLEGCG
jgi:hypothetical protein